MAQRTPEALRIEIKLAADAAAGLIHGIRCTPVPSDYPIDDPRSGQVTLQLGLSVLWEGSSWLWRQAGYRLTERVQYVVTAGDFWRHALHVATMAESFASRVVRYTLLDEQPEPIPVTSAVELAAVLAAVQELGGAVVSDAAEHLVPAYDPRDGIDRIQGTRFAVEVDGCMVPMSADEVRAMGAEVAVQS